MYKKWTFGSIASIYMKEQRENCANCGYVSLFNSGYKIYATINIVSEYILDYIQNGFRKSGQVRFVSSLLGSKLRNKRNLTYRL